MSIECDELIPILRVVMQRLQKMLQAAEILFRLIDMRLAIGFGVSFLIVVFGFGMFEGQLVAANSAHLVKLSAVEPHNRIPSKPFAGDRTQTSQPKLGPHQAVEPSAANRLKHSDLTGAALTRNRLTGSHLFVDVPATPHAHNQ